MRFGDERFETGGRKVGGRVLIGRRLLKFRHTEEEIIRNNEIVRRELRNWDLWGPLIICTTLGIVQSSSFSEQTSLVFASVFFIVWGGGAVLTLNAQLLAHLFPSSSN